MGERVAEFQEWFAAQRNAHHYEVRRAPLDRLDGWSVDSDSGVVRHRSGRFFSVEGVEVSTDHGPTECWAQPILNQPEMGILGILVKWFDGVLHFLMQAKMEPGNIDLLELSPTVQATRSNYTGVHRGKAVPYLEYFTAPRGGRIISDVLQSEQGAWFLSKRNRNMIVEVAEDVPVRDGFRWLTAEEIGELLRSDHLVNMDSRTVLAGYPFPVDDRVPATTGPFQRALRLSAQPGVPGMHTRAELLSWFTEAKARYRLTRTTVPLTSMKGWICGQEEISHELDRYFTVLGVEVEAGNREVSSWSQPMIAPRHRGVIALVVKMIDGVLHVLAHARSQAGTLDIVEIAPTVQCAPGNYVGEPAERRPAFLDYVLSAEPSCTRFDALHSEEGGRFYHAVNRYLVVEAGEEVPQDASGPDFVWMTVGQLAELARYGNYVNVEARNLLTCLRFC